MFSRYRWTSCCIMTIFIVLAVVMGDIRSTDDVGQWQGRNPLKDAEVPNKKMETASKWIVMDTGGSGGMFGQGDIRQNLLDVAFWSDGRHGAACGAGGAFYTNDGGLTWKRIRQHPRKEYPNEVGIQYYCVKLSGPQEIWLAEGQHPRIGRHLWHSTDAGKTWEDASTRFPGPFKCVSDMFVQGKNIWLLAGGYWSNSYRSSDGGKTWQRLTVLPDTPGFCHIFAAVPTLKGGDELSTVYVLGQLMDTSGQLTPVLARTDDAGKNWKRIDLPENLPENVKKNLLYYRIVFITPRVGIIGLPASGLKFPKYGVFEKNPNATASILITTDGGMTWKQRSLPNEELMITALWQDPTDQQHVFAGVWNGFLAQIGQPRQGPSLYETFDGGENWSIVIRGKSQINAIFGLDGQHVWAVGNVVGFAVNDVIAILKEPGKNDN